jgi:hypothetical protein
VKKLGASEIFFMIIPEGSIEDLIAAMERFAAWREPLSASSISRDR